jgi:hypothetical protein
MHRGVPSGLTCSAPVSRGVPHSGGVQPFLCRWNSTLLPAQPTIQPAVDEGIRLGVIFTPAFFITGRLNVGLRALDPSDGVPAKHYHTIYLSSFFIFFPSNCKLLARQYARSCVYIPSPRHAAPFPAAIRPSTGLKQPTPYLLVGRKLLDVLWLCQTSESSVRRGKPHADHHAGRGRRRLVTR